MYIYLYIIVCSLSSQKNVLESERLDVEQTHADQACVKVRGKGDTPLLLFFLGFCGGFYLSVLFGEMGGELGRHGPFDLGQKFGG